jgi:ABC-2 type transport system ATP-binding protein
MIVRVEQFSKHYGTTIATRDVSFDVRQGEVFALLGPNGSGKTTTLKAIVGLTIPTSGRIFVHDLDIRRFPRETRHLIGYLPQRVMFPESQTAREVLRFYCKLRRLPNGRVDVVLEQFGFEGVADRLVSEFSGGMLQRLGLAVVSLADAPILLMDEPTASLDPHGVKRFREFVLNRKENGKAVIFSTHLLAEAEQLADRVGIFVGGRVVAQESIETLKLAFERSKTIEDMYLHYVAEHEAD